MSRDVLKRLDVAEIVARRCKGADWPRPLLGETPIPERWLGLVMQPDGRRRFVPAGEDPRPQRDDTLVLVRNRPIVVPVGTRGAKSADGHVVDAEIELLVRWTARDDDLAALTRTLLVEDELTLDALALAFDNGGAPGALRDYIAARPATELVTQEQRDSLLAALRGALKELLFSTGSVLERIGRCTLTSATLKLERQIQDRTERQLRELEARSVVEQAARVATRRRLDDLSSILDKLRSAAQADEQTKWHELLPALAPAERGRLLENLWRLTPGRSRAGAIVVVAGRVCAFLDPAEPTSILRQATLPDDLGGLRSVSFDAGRNALLVGAAEGVWLLNERGDVQTQFRVPTDTRPRTGFNAAITAGGRLYATHSQLGAWSWSLDEPTETCAILQPVDGRPQTVRAITVDDQGRVLLAADDAVHAYDAAGEELWQSRPAGGTIHCLAPLEGGLYVGTASGALLHADLNRPNDWVAVHRAPGAIESIAARRWDDLIELVIPAGDAGICGVYGHSGITTTLMRAGTAIRRAWACDDTLIGMTEQRDRLVVLNGAADQRTCCEVSIVRLLGQAIQDADLLTRRSESELEPENEESA